MHVNHDSNSDASAKIEFSDFLKVDIRVGQIVSAEVFKEARKPAYILMIDFGAKIGIKKSSAQIVKHYSTHDLIGKKIAAVVNFGPKQIGPIKSEVLTLGFADEEGHVVLISPDRSVPNGSRLH